MPQPDLTCRIKPYIQPFERELALREICEVSQATLCSDEENAIAEFRLVDSQVDAEYLASRLAYWEYVRSDRRQWTRQLRREATTYLAKNGTSTADLPKVLPLDEYSIPIPNRRCLRYGPHDIHEYRGKFFPQLVNALLNISDLPQDSVVLDPMCGSGTTLVEANLAGHNAIGLDINPLSILIARTKCDILHIPPQTIIAEYERLNSALTSAGRGAVNSMPYLSSLPERDLAYLQAWFAPDVLADLDVVASFIEGMDSPVCRDLFRLCLSDILRRVSWQKTDDLRIRRDPSPSTDFDAVAEFLAQTEKTVRQVVAFLLEETGQVCQQATVSLGDAREVANTLSATPRRADVVITSPPYATALPYLDTDRLSLCYLKLMPRSMHRPADSQMIGNREVTERQRIRLWEQYRKEEETLPLPVRSLLEEVNAAYSNGGVGFRRRNLPALLAKYFLDMRKVFVGIRQVVNHGAHIYVVIGDNHTVAHGQRIEIETARLLGETGVSVGMELVETIPMDMLTPRDVFKKNAVASEHILHFRVWG